MTTYKHNSVTATGAGTYRTEPMEINQSGPVLVTYAKTGAGFTSYSIMGTPDGNIANGSILKDSTGAALSGLTDNNCAYLLQSPGFIYLEMIAASGTPQGLISVDY